MRAAQDVENGWLPVRVRERAVTLDNLGTIGSVLSLEKTMELAKAVVGDGWEQVVGNVDILPVDKHSPAREWVGEENPRVGQSTFVGVGVLVDVTKQHVEH